MLHRQTEKMVVADFADFGGGRVEPHLCPVTTFGQQLCIQHCPSLIGNCIQNFHLGRYIVGYTIGNLFLRQRASGAVKRDFRTYI